MALTAQQRSNVITALTNWATTNRPGIAAATWANLAMGQIDLHRNGAAGSATHWSLTWGPFVQNNITTLSSALRTAIANHVAGG